MRKKLSLLLILALIMSVVGMGCQSGQKPVTTGAKGVIQDEEFGNTYIDLTIVEFNNLGFTFGDSVDISFDNGKKITDIPYYSGYYCSVGELLLCGYPGYPHVAFARNYGESTWKEYGLSESSKMTVTLNTKAKYLKTEETFSLKYSKAREDFDSDAVFANFREISGGKLRKESFYRAASPCDNTYNRARYADELAKEYGVEFFINLSDTEEKYATLASAEGFGSNYYNWLYKQNKVLFLGLNANFTSDEFAKKVADAFYTMTKNKGPCLIHCVESKDRTGFVCAILLALADASSEDIIKDYMITYANFYGITQKSDPERYEAITRIIKNFLCYMCGAEYGTAVESLQLKAGAESYLKKGGLSDEQIAAIEEYLCKES